MGFTLQDQYACREKSAYLPKNRVGGKFGAYQGNADKKRLPAQKVCRENGVTATERVSVVFGWSTKLYHQQSGLVAYEYRFYDPELGRWPNRDPIEESGGVNLYAFVGNNVVNRWDYLGLTFSEQKNTFDWWMWEKGTIQSVSRGAIGQFRAIAVTYPAQTIWTPDDNPVVDDGKVDLKIFQALPTDTFIGKLATADGHSAILGHEDRRLEVYKKAYEEYLLPLDGSDCSKEEIQKIIDEQFHPWVEEQQNLITWTEVPVWSNRSGKNLIDGIQGTHQVGTPPKLKKPCCLETQTQ